ncbi:DegT/DnrJ/EryC1/StrS family aminotransferase [Candidatus Bathyarchaeota archaeon]|nr:DegT/DnrJ/EryC1/StrS family aminotransferase [Candidatus Bathyarchaeota archaeon]MBS7612941.1 DegT/DnrJ/EryC1/StrS family aminotransferase [Candidatus Bathyarchaeota archaeon]MBS7618133.1 DegT/DnrJ/EryC1/StrS family aminotransferase [Candidatus Bathyarchaeota archaeon]
MSNKRGSISEKDLVLFGGEKFIKGFQGKEKPKIGVEEFLELADTWGYSASTIAKIKEIIEKEEVPSPHLARYYNPRPSKVKQLEEYAKKLFGVEYALVVNSGTSALYCAYVGCGIGPCDEVIVPGYTFIATAAAVVGCRAIPVIAEVDDSLTIDPEDVKRKITPRTKAIVPVHMAGNCSNMDAIMKIAKKYNLMIIEDNAQACGGRYKGRYLGTIGHVGCFSLSSYKIVGAGEGGLVLTSDEKIYLRAISYHDTAACWRPDRYAKERFPGELFCGQNYRMSELEGSVILVQLRKMEERVKRYNTNMRRVLSRVKKFRKVMPRQSNDIYGDVGYCLIFFAESSELAGKLAEALQAEGVPTGARGTRMARDWHIYAYWDHILEKKTVTPEGCPFTCPYYKGKLPEYSPDMCPKTLDLINRALFMYISEWWTEEDCINVARAINKVFSVFCS